MQKSKGRLPLLVLLRTGQEYAFINPIIEVTNVSIPVYILSGFLGSGKTTLLIRLLEESVRRRLVPAILMNELGREDVDGAIIQEQLRLPVTRLLDGCVCCSKRSEVEQCLNELAARKPDLIFMELTGVAEPAQLRAMFDSPARTLPEELQLERILSVADAGSFLQYNSIFSADRQLVRLLRGQLAAADLVLINKRDLVTDSELGKITRAVRKCNPYAALLPTVRCAIDAASLLHSVHPQEALPDRGASEPKAALTDQRLYGSACEIDQGKKAPPENNPAGATSSLTPLPVLKSNLNPAGADSDSDGPSGTGIRSITLTMPMDAKEADQARIEAFLSGMGDSLLRAKGYFRQSSGALLLQHSGGRAEWQGSSYPGKPYLVLIGKGLQEDAIKEQWRLLFSTSGD